MVAPHLPTLPSCVEQMTLPTRQIRCSHRSGLLVEATASVPDGICLTGPSPVHRAVSLLGCIGSTRHGSILSCHHVISAAALPRVGSTNSSSSMRQPE